MQPNAICTHFAVIDPGQCIHMIHDTAGYAESASERHSCHAYRRLERQPEQRQLLVSAAEHSDSYYVHFLCDFACPSDADVKLSDEDINGDIWAGRDDQMPRTLMVL